MNLLTPFRAVGWTAAVFTAEKSFAANPVLGSRRLNELGLHRARVAAAARMAAFRRRFIPVPEADREAYERDGFVIRPDYLPAGLFEAVRAEVFGGPHRAREMRQGRTVTRMIPLSASARARLPQASAVAFDPALARLAGYVAGRTGAALHHVQTVIAEPERGPQDPQAALHADTFHSTAKYWLFLHDVTEEDGPFMFAPGSHRLTPERLDWEHRRSLTARAEGRAHHSHGSFRIRPDELAALGYAPPRRVAVKANTLVVADTFGFHARAPSAKRTVRVEIHGQLRRNPFLPWNGLDPLTLPGLKGREYDLHFGWKDYRGIPSVWRDVGEVRADDPASV
ncbi:MAG: phytanoyl-CoA dioxygenase family protein [Pikeienuella sp.]|uniref:phytanoyl-CoA dioxygenase family protein n=1 Tax=Pikeienuella sp. TaxID=2831957 RepID=UPI00391BEE38